MFLVPLTETNLLPWGDDYRDTCLTGLCLFPKNITSQNVSKELEIEDPYVFYGQPHYKVIVGVCNVQVHHYNCVLCYFRFVKMELYHLMIHSAI